MCFSCEILHVNTFLSDIHVNPIVCVLQHLLFSVTDPQFRVKPAGVSDVSPFSRFSSFPLSILGLSLVFPSK